MNSVPYSRSEIQTRKTTVIEHKIPMDGTYLHAIQFGNGAKNMVIITGVSLLGLIGGGLTVANTYEEFIADYTVYLFDRKKVVPEGYRVEDMAEDVYRGMQFLRVSDACFYGVSQGGMIAQVIAAEHPETVKKLCLCSTQCRATERAKASSALWSTLARDNDVVELNRAFFRMVCSPAFQAENGKALSVVEKLGSPEDCRRLSILSDAFGRFDYADKVGQIRCPVLVIGDENDAVLGAEASRELAERLGCGIYMYDEYSHAVYDEAPDIKERIYGFFQG